MEVAPQGKKWYDFRSGESLNIFLKTETSPVNKKKRVVHFLLLLIIAALPVWAHAESSVNVSLGRDIYVDMEFWAAEGLIGGQLNSTRPFVASEVGNQLVEAMDRCYAAKTPSAACLRIQNRYARLFEPEWTEAKSPERVMPAYLKPIETFSLSYSYLNGPFSVFNSEGIAYGDGHNAVALLQSQARVLRVFSFFVEPALIYNQQAVHAEDGDNTDFTLHKGYAKLTLFNVELQVGRDSLWWGPGYHGALLMSNNAKPFDMIKLSNPEPALLPWIFSFLGPVRFNLIFSRFDDERNGTELDHPYFYGFRLDMKPHPYLEIGASQLVMFGGDGRSDLSLSEIFTILYSNTNRDDTKTDSNQQVAVDFALTFPQLKKHLLLIDGLKIYGEIGAEDTGFLPDRRAYIAGVAFYKPLGLEQTVLRGEYALISPNSVPDAWYRHSAYPMRYEGVIFGHHAGTDSEDLFIEWSQSFEKFFYKLGFDRERSGIETEEFPQIKNQYFIEAGWRPSPHYGITLRYAYEDINNAGYVQDENQRNYVAGVETAMYF